MTKNTAPFSFDSRDTYQSFVKEAKNKVEALTEDIRKEKHAIKEMQRKTNSANVSYNKLQDMREKIRDTEELRAHAKVEASRQYVSRTV